MFHFGGGVACGVVGGTEGRNGKKRSFVLGVGGGGCCSPRRYQDADLEIILRFSTKFSTPYYRLYVIENGRQYFLIERGEQDLRKLVAFISSHTGWPLRPQTIWPG